MNNKKTVCMTIDFEVWLYFASKNKEMNISSTVNNFLKNMMMLKKDETPSSKLQEQIEEKKDIILENQKRILELNSQLSIALKEEQEIFAKEEQMRKARENELMIMERTIRANNDMIDLI